MNIFFILFSIYFSTTVDVLPKDKGKLKNKFIFSFHLKRKQNKRNRFNEISLSKINRREKLFFIESNFER